MRKILFIFLSILTIFSFSGNILAIESNAIEGHWYWLFAKTPFSSEDPSTFLIDGIVFDTDNHFIVWSFKDENIEEATYNFNTATRTFDATFSGTADEDSDNPYNFTFNFTGDKSYWWGFILAGWGTLKTDEIYNEEDDDLLPMPFDFWAMYGGKYNKKTTTANLYLKTKKEDWLGANDLR